VKSANATVRMALALVSLLVPVTAIAQGAIPNVFNPNESDLQKQTHFLVFVGSYIPETATSGRAYYNAIDPNQTKRTFTQWLKYAGFIGQESDWRPYGQQTILTGQPTGAGAYGPNIINTDSHAIVLNAADLGFVRNQFVRCKPSCSARNPIIFTYLENYPVAPFAASGSKFGSGGSSYPTQAEATAAIKSAIQRPLGVLNPATGTGDGGVCSAPDMCVERIADVAFEWSAGENAATNSSTRFGQLLAYIFSHNGGGITETIAFPDGAIGQSVLNGVPVLDYSTGQPRAIQGPLSAADPFADPFAPNLDGLGFKQMPGVCLVCHGGKPSRLTSTGAYPRKGIIDGFRLLPLDNRNLMFPDVPFPGIGDFTLGAQEPQIKRYNQAVLATVAAQPQRDDQGVVRPPHIAEVIRGWYSTGGNYSDDTTMSSSTQNGGWIPKGWRQSPNGTAPAGSEKLYGDVVGPSCRSCHFNRELSLDFGTAANFHQESDLLQLSLLAECKQNNPDPNAKFMPLAHLTFQRFWEASDGSKTLTGPYQLGHTVDELANAFNQNGVAGYCASNP
jgi:hypothetical protein